MNILDDFKQYVGPNGLISDVPGRNSLNDILYTSISLIIMRDNGVLKNCKEPWVLNLIIQLNNCFKKPGLLTRTPDHHHDLEAHDDYIGICALGKQIETFYPHTIIAWGVNHFWNYNNVDPDKFTWKSWLGRMPWDICHFYYSAWLDTDILKPNFFLRLMWWLAMMYAALFTKKEDQDGWMLTWLMLRTHPGTLPENLWRKRLYKFYPNGIKDLNYVNNGDHPINRWWIK